MSVLVLKLFNPYNSCHPGNGLSFNPKCDDGQERSPGRAVAKNPSQRIDEPVASNCPSIQPANDLVEAFSRS